MEAVQNDFNVTMAREIERKQKVQILKGMETILSELKRLSDKIDNLEQPKKVVKRVTKTEE